MAGRDLIGMWHVYHTGTDEVASWLVQTAKLVGQQGPKPPRAATSTATASEKGAEHEIRTTKEYLELSIFIADHWRRYGPFPRLQYVLRKLDNVIDFRSHLTQFYKPLPGGAKKLAKDEGHQHFVEVMRRVREHLRRGCLPVSEQQTDASEGLDNRFRALDVSDNSSSSSSSSASDEEEDETPIQVTHGFDAVIDDEETHLLVLCAIREVSAGIDHISRVWELVASGDVDRGSAAEVTVVLISMYAGAVRKCDNRLAMLGAETDVASILRALEDAEGGQTDVASILRAPDDAEGGLVGAFALAASLLGRLHSEWLPRLKAGQWPTDLWGGRDEAEGADRVLELLCVTAASVLLSEEIDREAGAAGKSFYGEPFFVRDPLMGAIGSFMSLPTPRLELCFLLLVYASIDRVMDLTTLTAERMQMSERNDQLARLQAAVDDNLNGDKSLRVSKKDAEMVLGIQHNLTVGWDKANGPPGQPYGFAKYRMAALNPVLAALHMQFCRRLEWKGQRAVSVASTPIHRGLAQLYDAAQKAEVVSKVWDDMEALLDDRGTGSILGSRAQRNSPNNRPLVSALVASRVPLTDLRGPVSAWDMDAIVSKLEVIGWQSEDREPVTHECLGSSCYRHVSPWEPKDVKGLVEKAGWNYRDFRAGNTRVLQATAPTSFPRSRQEDAPFSRPGSEDKMIYLPAGFPPEGAILLAILDKEAVKAKLPYERIQRWAQDVIHSMDPKLKPFAFLHTIIELMYEDAKAAEANKSEALGHQPFTEWIGQQLSRVIMAGEPRWVSAEWVQEYGQNIVVQIGQDESDLCYAVARAGAWCRVDKK